MLHIQIEWILQNYDLLICSKINWAMKSAREKLALCFVIIGSLFQIITGKDCVTRMLVMTIWWSGKINWSKEYTLAQTTVSQVSFSFDGTEFEFFQASPDVSWLDAQIQCINWGGNLSTINSSVEDSLLLYSIPDLNATFSCHVGLNDINNEAGTDGDAFVWIDGSTSIYRNWGTLQEIYPLSQTGFDCVRHRYRISGILSHGWVNAPCSDTRNCHLCSKQGISLHWRDDNPIRKCKHSKYSK